MKALITLILAVLFAKVAFTQELKFGTPLPYTVQEEKQDKKVIINFTLEKATKDCDITVVVNEDNTSATKAKDYIITTISPIHLTSSNNYKSQFEVTIKSDQFVENLEELDLTFIYTDEKKVEHKVDYPIQILDINDGSINDPQYTTAEANAVKHLSFDLFTGGNFDFSNQLKFSDVGGEVITNAVDIFGENYRFGGFVGISKFQNFSLDSSNRNVVPQHIRIDTGAYISGKTNYLERTLVLHKKLSVSQWSYYANITYRLNKTRSDLFNIYASFRSEVLRTSTETQFLIDTISNETTNRALGNSAIFQSGKGFFLQKALDTQTDHFFSVGLPIFLNAKNKFSVYVEPDFGISAFHFTSYDLNNTSSDAQKVTTNKILGFSLFRYRLTEQYSGLNITIGGEVRDVFATYHTTINAYLGIRVNIANWFNKANNNKS